MGRKLKSAKRKMRGCWCEMGQGSVHVHVYMQDALEFLVVWGGGFPKPTKSAGMAFCVIE